MNYLMKYDNGAMGDTLAILPFVKDFTEQRPNDKLFVQWTTSNMMWHKQRDLIFSHLNCFVPYDGKSPVDESVYVTSDESPQNGRHTPILDRPYLAFDKKGVVIERNTNRIPWDFKPGELESFSYSDDKPLALINAGYHALISSKNWGVSRYQQLVDGLKDRINFVQIGETVINGFHHQPLNGLYGNLLNRTPLPALAVLMHRADFVFTNVTGTNLLATIPSYKKRHVFTFCGQREPSWFFSRIKSDDLDYRLLQSDNDYSECFKEFDGYCNIDVIGKCKHQKQINGETVCGCLYDISVDKVMNDVAEILNNG